MACECIKTEVGKGTGSVKGYITTQECAECKARREQDAILAAQRKAEQEKEQEKEALIQAKIRDLAEKELVAEGKIDIEGKVVKAEITEEI